jgi:hypothetical protein
MSIEQSLKPCPLCGRPVEISLCGDFERKYYMITRSRDKNACKCRLSFTSDSFDPLLATDDERKLIELKMIDDWNRRA